MHDGISRCCTQVDGALPNLLMLGTELEVPLDAITKAPPEMLSFKMDFTQAVQKRYMKLDHYKMFDSSFIIVFRHFGTPILLFELGHPNKMFRFPSPRLL